MGGILVYNLPEPFAGYPACYDLHNGRAVYKHPKSDDRFNVYPYEGRKLRRDLGGALVLFRACGYNNGHINMGV